MSKHPKSKAFRNTAQETRSWDLGFNFAWPVFQRYRVKDGILREEGRVLKVIAPVAELQLLGTLAGVYQGKTTVENFACEFGYLGHAHICEVKNRRGGDPLPWFRTQAKNIFEILNLLAAIGRNDARTIRQALKIPPDDDPIRSAQRHIEIILNPHLEGIPRQLWAGVDGIRSVFKPRALIDVVYWQLADLAEGREVVRRCLECESLFTSTDPRRQYCPGKNCSMRRRVRLFRKRQKGKP